MANCCCEVTWLLSLLVDFGIEHSQYVPSYCDNQSALHLSKNFILHERTKHMELDYHFIRDKVTVGIMDPRYIHMKEQLADLFTKGLSVGPLTHLLSKMSILDIHTLRYHLEEEY